MSNDELALELDQLKVSILRLMELHSRETVALWRVLVKKGICTEEEEKEAVAFASKTPHAHALRVDIDRLLDRIAEAEGYSDGLAYLRALKSEGEQTE